jgi:cytochrome c-type biogenesis protein
LERFPKGVIMDSQWLGVGSALWLGVLTSISPCPLATNLAAVSYVGRDAGCATRVLSSGLMYTLGRVVAYTAIAWLVVASILSTQGTAVWLQRNINLFLGPFLVLVGMVLVGLITIPIPTGATLISYHERLQKWGLLGAGLLGFLFALSFCPVSAALFFGSLIPLAITEHSPLLLPAAYGVGTGLPVLAFAMILIFGAKSVGLAFQRISSIERWARPATGVVILGVGIYLTLNHVHKIGD